MKIYEKTDIPACCAICFYLRVSVTSAIKTENKYPENVFFCDLPDNDRDNVCLENICNSFVKRMW